MPASLQCDQDSVEPASTGEPCRPAAAYHRRAVLGLAAGGIALTALPRAGWAQAYPTRPITLMVFVGAGGSPDIKARIVAQALSQRLGQPVVVENRPGAGGNLSLQAVARAPADGHTLLLVATPHAVNATLHDNVSVLRDIVPIAGINGDPFVMVVTPSLAAKSLPEFIAYAKANPGKINITSSGSGNLSHLSGEMFKMMTGLELVHVPYKGTPAALTGVAAGEVHVMFDAFTSAYPQIQSGRLRALAVTGKSRVDVLPDVPTVDSVVPGYEVSGILGIGAPKGTSAEIVTRLNAEVNAILAEPATKAQLAGAGSRLIVGTPTDFGKLIRDEADRWAKVVKFAAIRPR